MRLRSVWWTPQKPDDFTRASFDDHNKQLGWFHGWADTSQTATAICEDTLGRIHLVYHEAIRFDSPPSEMAQP